MNTVSVLLLIILAFVLVGVIAYAGTYVLLKPIVEWVLEPLKKNED